MSLKKVKNWETDQVMVTLEILEFDPYTGRKTSNPYPYTCNLRHWNTVQFPNLETHGLKVIEVLHMPEGAEMPKEIGYPGQEKPEVEEEASEETVTKTRGRRKNS